MKDQFVEKLSSKIDQCLSRGKFVHEKIDTDWDFFMDRTLPYICLYRFSEGQMDPLIARIVKTNPSHLVGSRMHDGKTTMVLRHLIKAFSDKFGAFMIVEFLPPAKMVEAKNDPEKKIRIISPQKEPPQAFRSLSCFLKKIRIKDVIIGVEEDFGLRPDLILNHFDEAEINSMECLYAGIELEPFYVNQEDNSHFPFLSRSLVKEMSLALKKTLFEFLKIHTSHKADSFLMLGRKAVPKRVWEIDTQLAEINEKFRFLLLVTPINTQSSWLEFKKNKFIKPPVFHYPFLNIDPGLLKRDLFNIPIEEVDDPTLSFLFYDKRAEIDKMLTMLGSRGTPDFFYGSMQLYGNIPESLLILALDILHKFPSEPEISHEMDMKDSFSAEEFAELAKVELDFLREQCPEVDTRVDILPQINGILVSKGRLCIGKEFRIPKKRAEALIQHEIGTHVLTYYNGKYQPLKQLYTGVPGYEELQEGIAVLSEYLVGGLNRSRIRSLAARVLTVNNLIKGYDFIQSFLILCEEFEFGEETAFNIVMRVYRGGGLTKDAVYLKGLVELMEYLRDGNDLEPLLIGKIKKDYLNIIEELIQRKILKPVPIRPRYLMDEKIRGKIEGLKKSGSIETILGIH